MTFKELNEKAGNSLPEPDSTNLNGDDMEWFRAENVSYLKIPAGTARKIELVVDGVPKTLHPINQDIHEKICIKIAGSFDRGPSTSGSSHTKNYRK